MSKASRVTVELGPNGTAVLEQLAEEREMSRSAVVRQAIGILQAMREANRDGYYVGISRNREALDTLIVAP